MQKNTLKKLKHGEIEKPAFKYTIDNRFDRRKLEKIRGRIDRHNQINLKKQVYRQTDLIRPRKNY